MNAPLTSKRRRDRHVEAEAAALDGDVAGQPAQRHAQPDQPADGRHQRARRRSASGPTAPASAQLHARGRSSRARTPPSPARPSRAWRCCRSTRRSPCAACPASALAGSVAPIRSRHFLIASGASRHSTTHGPDDMKSVSAAEERPRLVHVVEALRPRPWSCGSCARRTHREARGFDAGEDLAHGARHGRHLV